MVAQNRGLASLNSAKSARDLDDVGVVSIDDTNFLHNGLCYEPKATIQNFGDQLKSFDVTMHIADEYSCTKKVILPAKASVTVIFNSLILKKGTITFHVKVKCINDINPLNDTISTLVVVAGNK